MTKRTKIIVKNNSISAWLLTCCFLVVVIIFVGGVTRLTSSGLSITEWKPVVGAVPPISQHDWTEEFEKYKKIPEFKIENPKMTLSEFKKIFWWEYFHRLIGRVIGVVFFVPLILFWKKSQLSKRQKLSFLALSLFGVTQGFLGWYMVKSGLVNATSVSHIRLGMHLVSAFIILSILFWELLNSLPQAQKTKIKLSQRILINFSIITLFLQILYGALLAGTKGGLLYNSFFFAVNDVLKEFSQSKCTLTNVSICAAYVVNGSSTINLIHRVLATLLSGLVLTTFLCNFKDQNLKPVLTLLLLTLLTQFTLGAFSVYSSLNIIIASMHQLNSCFLLFALLLFKYKTRK